MSEEVKVEETNTDACDSAAPVVKGKSALVKKLMSWLGIVVIVLLVLAALGLTFAGTTLKHSIQLIGSQVTKCDITIKDISVSLLKGEITIEQFVIGNPEGFKTESAICFEKIHLAIKPMSLLSSKIVVNEVEIIKPEVTFEVGLLESNIGKILDNVNSVLPGDKDKKDKKEEKVKSGKAVQVDHVFVQDGKIRVSAKILMGAGLPVPLPDIELKDIGKDEEINGLEVTAQILKSFLTNILTIVK